jgi:uncharacterized protein YecE (DUF72 family)
MGRVAIGTASWTDKTLISSGGFYPSGATSAEARLRYYASQFPIVEVDATYYYPPSERNAILWVERTPDDFTFHIKAYSLLTLHPTRPNSLYKDLQERVPPEHRSKRFLYSSHLPSEAVDEVWERFADSLMPLHSAGKLGIVHFQFPEWFVPGDENRNYIVECKQRLKDYRIAVEFRNATWMSDRSAGRTLEFLSRDDIPYTSVDMPQGFKSSLPPVAHATSDLAYVRFHGRNEENWKKKSETATPRFAYLYSEEELLQWVPRIKGLAEEAKEVHVLMNNCYRDYAVTNARQLASLL